MSSSGGTVKGSGWDCEDGEGGCGVRQVSAGARSTCGIVEGSTEPRSADSGSWSSSVPGGCTGSYSSVASCPLEVSSVRDD